MAIRCPRGAGELLDLPVKGVNVVRTLEEALAYPADVLVDFTSTGSVTGRCWRYGGSCR
jgi:hypothetical protein